MTEEPKTATLSISVAVFSPFKDDTIFVLCIDFCRGKSVMGSLRIKRKGIYLTQVCTKSTFRSLILTLAVAYHHSAHLTKVCPFCNLRNLKLTVLDTKSGKPACGNKKSDVINSRV
jgi:hypothetical protein